MSPSDILSALDDSNDGHFHHFVCMGAPHSYLLDARLNVFRGENDRWAIAVERLGYSSDDRAIFLEIYYYGNALRNLDVHDKQYVANYRTFVPADLDEIEDTFGSVGILGNELFWTVRGKSVVINYPDEEYAKHGIKLRQSETGEKSAEHVSRLVVAHYRDLFRAADNELYSSIELNLKKILVLDDWHHRDYVQLLHPEIDEPNLRRAYDINKQEVGLDGIPFDEFAASFIVEEEKWQEYNRKQMKDTLPSSYETWQMIADVIVHNDPSLYKPTLPPNTHWSNWPDSGCL